MSASVDERLIDEVEALQAILMNDVVVKDENNVPHTIEMVVHPSTGNDAEKQFVCITLVVKLTPGYPENSPEVILKNPRGLDDQVVNTINTQIQDKISECLGQPVVFELIELIRENLTESNLPTGQCAICLYDFAKGDIFNKTQCYHYFHSYCLANHVTSGEKYYIEELEKLPMWQRLHEPSYQQTCPVCRAVISCDLETLRAAPPPMDSFSDPPFRLTSELKALQLQMASLLERQVARGGVVGNGEPGPPPLTITTPADNHNEASSSGPSTPQDVPKPEPTGDQQDGQPATTPGSPRTRPAYRGPYRGFNRRGKPGRGSRGNGRGAHAPATR